MNGRIDQQHAVWTFVIQDEDAALDFLEEHADEIEWD